MIKIASSFIVKVFRLISLITLIICLFTVSILAQDMVYVDVQQGNDNNPGTKSMPINSLSKALEIIKNKDNQVHMIKLNPGIYILDNHLSVETDKQLGGQRLVIEASILPDDTSWTPDKMPVVTSRAIKGGFPFQHWVVSFLINASHVSIKGIKFTGYFYPHTRYFPIARINKETTDLRVEQCMFIGDANISQIQAGVIAHGNEVRIDHCIFYQLRNTVVFFLDCGEGAKHGNGITNSIIYGASQAVWSVSPDKDFKFDNNIVSNCKYVWARNSFNTTDNYTINNSIIVNNKYYQGIADSVRLNPGKFNIKENNVIKEGEVQLRVTGKDDRPTLLSVDEPLPIDYMHPISGTFGYNSGAGLFKITKY